MAAGDTNTVPFCGSCGWDAIARNINKDRFCDSCGADLTRFGFTASSLPPDGPPPSPNASAGTGEVVFAWAADGVAFPEGYDFGYSLGGAAPIVTPQATSPQTVVAAPGVEVCGALQGYRGGVGSGYSANGCDTSL